MAAKQVKRRRVSVVIKIVHVFVLSAVVSLGLMMQRSAEVTMLKNLNATRVAAGLPALALDSRLCRLAFARGIDMVRHGYFDHPSLEQLAPPSRSRARRFWAGENIAEGPDEQQAYSALVSSPPHYENIVQPKFHRVGIAAVQQSDGEWLFVQDFSN